MYTYCSVEGANVDKKNVILHHFERKSVVKHVSRQMYDVYLFSSLDKTRYPIGIDRRR